MPNTIMASETLHRLNDGNVRAYFSGHYITITVADGDMGAEIAITRELARSLAQSLLTLAGDCDRYIDQFT